MYEDTPINVNAAATAATVAPSTETTTTAAAPSALSDAKRQAIKAADDELGQICGFLDNLLDIACGSGKVELAQQGAHLAQSALSHIPEYYRGEAATFVGLVVSGAPVALDAVTDRLKKALAMGVAAANSKLYEL